MLAKNCASLGVHTRRFSPTSVQFKVEISDRFSRLSQIRERSLSITYIVRERRGDPRVFRAFAAHSLWTCRPLRPRGDRNPLPPVHRFRHRPSPRSEQLGSPSYPAIRFKQGAFSRFLGSHFGTTCPVARLG